MSERVFIIHGRQSAPSEGWQPWLNNELSLRGYTVRTPAMPNTNNPKCHRWVEELTKMIGEPDEHCHLVGHSLGCPAILRYLETLKSDQRVGKIILVSGFTEDLNIPDIAHFTDQPFDFTAIRSRAKKFVCMYSDNDKYIRLDQFERLIEHLHATPIFVAGGGHFSGNEGCFQLPQALQAIIGTDTKPKKSA